jgi:hypothetical protein
VKAPRNFPHKVDAYHNVEVGKNGKNTQRPAGSGI